MKLVFDCAGFKAIDCVSGCGERKGKEGKNRKEDRKEMWEGERECGGR